MELGYSSGLLHRAPPPMTKRTTRQPAIPVFMGVRCVFQSDNSVVTPAVKNPSPMLPVAA
jgi:hypothetical protein